MGVAYASTILSYDTLSCNPACFHSIDEIASAVDSAVLNGARVINLSVVGSLARQPLFNALRRATAAGVIVVIAAGNDGTPDPDGFALQSAETVRSGLLIIAGAHGTNRLIAPGTNRAGGGAEWYIASYAGVTSYSTPVISGAVAMIAGAFPALTGADIANLLLTTADDAGAPGIDPVYGHGILNIGRAFAQAQILATARAAGSTSP
jgi:subtilisin family serine protease